MNYLIIRNDGKLYFQSFSEGPLISATTAQLVLTNKDPNQNLGDDFVFWSNYLTKPIMLEDGLTFKNFFKALMPWSTFFSLFTQVNLAEFYEEMDNEVDTASPNYKCIDYLMLYRDISFYPTRGYELQPKFYEANQAHEYEIATNYMLSGFIKGCEDPQDISYIPTQYLSNCPLILQEFSTIRFGDYFKKSDSSDSRTLKMDSEIFGIQNTRSGEMFLETEFHQISLETFLRETFRFFFRSIQKRDNGKTIKNNIYPTEKATVLQFPGNKKPSQSLEPTTTQENNGDNKVIEIPFKEISNKKGLDKFNFENLVNMMFKQHDLEDQMVKMEQIENKVVNYGEFEVAQAPENRKSSIGISNK